MRHIFEHAGVLLQVDYSPTKPDVTFHTVHVLDTNYKAVGPDLTPLLHDLLLLIPPHGPTVEAMTMLSAILEDLPCAP